KGSATSRRIPKNCRPEKRFCAGRRRRILARPGRQVSSPALAENEFRNIYCLPLVSQTKQYSVACAISNYELGIEYHSSSKPSTARETIALPRQKKSSYQENEDLSCRAVNRRSLSARSVRCRELAT